jgi:hypothetical protein
MTFAQAVIFLTWLLKAESKDRSLRRLLHSGEKKPAEAGFSQDHYRLPVGSDPCDGRSSMILKHSLCLS